MNTNIENTFTMQNPINVTKRSGEREPADLQKFHSVIMESCIGLENVSPSQIELKTSLELFDGIKTEDIQQAAIKAAADLISPETPDYQYAAARLNISNIRKIAYGRFDPPNLYDHIVKLVDMGIYDKDILTNYSKTEIEYLNTLLDHNRDMNFSYAATKQLEGKYLVQNRVTGHVYESPQMMYMLIAMCLFHKYKRTDEPTYHLNLIGGFYEAVSTFKISLPTPIMSGVRTPTRQFSSCVVIEAGDSLDSINGASAAIVKYVSQRAGIGIAMNSIRSIGSPIRGGEAQHTGKIPFIRKYMADVKCCSQGGVRGGAATVFFPLWDYEFEELVVLKNNRGVEDNRARHLDYGFLFNKLMYRRLTEDGNITFFSPSEVPGLLEAFYSNQAEFERLYTIYESDPTIRKRTMRAVEVFGMFASERASTGRIYLMNIDHVNSNSPFNAQVAPVKQSNLCLEIALPTSPLDATDPSVGEIALCTLAAFNLGTVDYNEIGHLAKLLVMALDSLLDYQNYPIDAAYRASMYRRTLGIGVINYAYALARVGLKYSDGSAIPLTHVLFEKIQYELLKASMELAKTEGACPGFKETTYADGVMPVDRYHKAIDKFANVGYQCDWEWLRAQIKEHGLRNSTLTALMPSETSSQISNATNGIEPPRGLVSVKASKDGILKQVVPDIKRLAHQYELLWDMPDNEGYLKLVAVMQKFVDQSISANTSYDPSKFPGGKVPTSRVVKDLIRAYSLGIKTLYYHNTRDNANDNTAVNTREIVEIAEDEGCAGGACKI